MTNIGVKSAFKSIIYDQFIIFCLCSSWRSFPMHGAYHQLSTFSKGMDV